MGTRFTHEDATHYGDDVSVTFGGSNQVSMQYVSSSDTLAIVSITNTPVGWGVEHITSIGIGAIVDNKCTAVEGGTANVHQTTLTFTLTGATHDLDLADGADHGTGIKIYDFPAGDILILGATCDGVVASVNTDGGGATFPLSLGSVVASDDATLTGTEADIIPSTTVVDGSSSDFHASLAASILFQRAGGTDLDLYLNAAVTNAVSTGAVTIEVTGTVTISWMNLGDY